jgi:hypothetical protein
MIPERYAPQIYGAFRIVFGLTFLSIRGAAKGFDLHRCRL